MIARSLCALALVVCSPLAVIAQTVRFDTNVGNIDLILNPSGDPNLEAHVANMLAYIEADRYKGVVINRADTGSDADSPEDDFVLQLGSALTNRGTLPASFIEFDRVEPFDPVIVDNNGDGDVDFDTSELRNTRSTVSLALSNDPNSGTSSFFVNIGDNSNLLDPQGFIPFAIVPDMSTVDLIMRLDQGVLPGVGLAGSNIPLLGSSRLVIVERTLVLDPNPAAAFATVDTVPAPQTLTTIPEPTSLVALLLAVVTVALGSRHSQQVPHI